MNTILKFIFNIVILTPVVAVAFGLFIKLLSEIKKESLDYNKEGNFVRNIIMYSFLLILVLFLIVIIGLYFFLPEVKLPMPLQILAIISCIFFWGFLTIIQAMGHAAGAGAPPIQKTIKEFINLVSKQSKVR